MKPFVFFTYFFMMIFFIGSISIVFTGCEGPDGKTGKDSNESCKQCHNGSTFLLARSIQHEHSVHATGGNFARNASDCAVCHTHEGFIDGMNTGKMTSIVPKQPTPPSCRTCHNIHTKYDSTDWALRTIAPVKLVANNEILDMGSGNLCVNCHQPLIPAPMPIEGGGDIQITSPYWGVHHSPQSAIVAGTLGYKFPGGSEKYGYNAHMNVKNGCVSCHMATPYGSEAGGHTMKVQYENHGAIAYNTSGCTSCHTDTKLLIAHIVTHNNEVEDLLSQLKIKLQEKSILNETGGINTPITLSANLGGALLNYKIIEEDRSLGMHNPQYTIALLKNTLAGI